MVKASYRIKGLCCAEEVGALRAALERRPGIAELTFDLLQGRLTVAFDPAVIRVEEIISGVAQTGMAAEPWVDGTRPAPSRRARWTKSALTASSGLLIAAGFIVHAGSLGWAAAIGHDAAGHDTPVAAVFLYLGAIAAGGWLVVPRAWGALRRLRPDMHLLMTVAVIGAMFLGEWFEAATVAFLFSLSLALESWSVDQARRAVEALMTLAPDTARVICCESRHEELRPIGRVAVGSTIVVRPGERIPLDGAVARGESSADQAPITGESLPVPKKPGDSVFAGSINHEGALEIVTTRPASDTTLARILAMVRDAQGRRASLEQWVERFARIYTPAVMVCAALTAILPPLFLGMPWSDWIYRGLALLVIACPCALVISSPVAIVAALTGAARRGVLIKGGRYIEAVSRLRALAFDKTGTLTHGAPSVRALVPLSGHDENELLEIAAAISANSEHPIGKAVVNHARERGLRPVSAGNYQASPGRGAVATLNGKPVWIGSHRMLHERGQEADEVCATLDQWSEAGNGAVVLGNDEHVCGMIAVADTLRPESNSAVSALKQAGIGHIAILSGDAQGPAEAIGREAGVDEVRAALLPGDKVQAIEDMIARYGAVGMIGDGVNDAPAMARATVGIAMGAAGTDVALETADIALMNDDLSRLAWLVRHCRRTMGIVRGNIAFSLIVKAAFVALALAGMASLWAAIAADMGVSLLVVFNALRLLGGREPNAA